MAKRRIEWRKVTRFSQLIAIILAVTILGVGFILGQEYERINQIKSTHIYYGK